MNFEEEFGIEISDAELETTTTVGEAAALIDSMV
jgi:acyl carrier protein